MKRINLTVSDAEWEELKKLAVNARITTFCKNALLDLVELDGAEPRRADKVQAKDATDRAGRITASAEMPRASMMYSAVRRRDSRICSSRRRGPGSTIAPASRATLRSFFSRSNSLSA